MIIPEIDLQQQGADERLRHASVVGEVAAIGYCTGDPLPGVPCRLYVEDPADALRALDSGMLAVTVPEGLLDQVGAPAERLAVEIEGGHDLAARIASLSSSVAIIVISPDELDYEALPNLSEASGDARLVVRLRAPMEMDVARLADLDISVQGPSRPGRLGYLLGAALRKPIEGRFWPTVVVDEAGQSLGLVWSTAMSIAHAVRERRGIYWSRSRDELWEKGATSGDTQELLRVDVDCDRDALRFTVRQHGTGFCHTGTRSCFGDEGFDLHRLEHILRARIEKPVAGSGTARLAADPELLAAKLREEVEELIAAEERVEVVHETADLLYFTLVSLIRGGGSLGDVLDELSRRNARVSRRPMRAKTALKGDGE